MSAPSEDRIHNLDDFAGFLSSADREGFEFVVIGGCAVGAYSHLLNRTCMTTDLDLLATPEALLDIVNWARASSSVEVIKTPKPRSLQVVVLQWNGLEVNVLTRSRGLPTAAQALQNARIFKLKSHGLLEVPIADPFDLLSNKLAVNRSKDQPHIVLLRKFLDEEVVASFTEGEGARNRLAPARRLMRVLGQKTLPVELAERLVPLASGSAEYRFLMNHVPEEEQARYLLETAPAELKNQLSRLLELRSWAP